jgi:cytochrome c553
MKALLILAVAAAPIVFAPVTVEMPSEEPQFAGPDADLLIANCAACHSAEMILAQPRMSEEQWRHSVEKMRTVYKAPVDEADAARLPAALVRLQEAAR